MVLIAGATQLIGSQNKQGIQTSGTLSSGVVMTSKKCGSMRTFKVLSLIIPFGAKSQWAEIVCRHDLMGLDYEIIHAKSWEEGLARAHGEYISFIDSDADFSQDYFRENMALFTNKKFFRKLAMVASAVDVKTNHKVYGYLLSLSGSFPTVSPSRIKSSNEPYVIQIGYVPGAIIRRSVLKHGIRLKDPLTDSIRFSLDMWLDGSMLYLNPNTSYIPHSLDGLTSPLHIINPPDRYETLPPIWKSRMVG